MPHLQTAAQYPDADRDQPVHAPAGYPALTVPSGYDETGSPQQIVFGGGFLSEPQLLAVGFAYEQTAQARVAPDLEATMALIEGMDETSP